MRSLIAAIVSWGPAGLLFLATLDSAGVPIPGGVDALLVFLAARTPTKFYLLALLASAGSLLGSYILFVPARKGGQVYLDRHTLKPRGAKLRGWFQHYGLLTVFVPAILPIPLPMKVFVVCAGALGVGTAPFLLTVAAARIPRYLALGYLGVSMGENASVYIKEHIWHLMGIAVCLFLFLLLLVKMSDRYRKVAIGN